MAKATYTGKLTDFGEAPFPGDVPKLWVAPKRGAFGAVGVLATRRVAVTVAPDGSFSVDLVPSAALMPPQSYLLRCEWSGGGSTEWEFTALAGGGNIKDMGVIDAVGLWRESASAALGPLVDAVFEASEYQPKKCIHLEAGKWVWDGPNGPLATHFLLPDHDGSLVARSAAWPTPASTPELNW